MSIPIGTWSPLPPDPPEPPFPRRTPWLPEPGPAAPGRASAISSVEVRGPDGLTERLLDQRVVALAGELDAEAANRAIAGLALLDASGDGPVQLRLSDLRVDLDMALELVDALDLMGAPVHATALGTLSGASVAVLAVPDVRTAGAHALLHLVEPRPPGTVRGWDVEAWAQTTPGRSGGSRSGWQVPAAARSKRSRRTCARPGCSPPRRRGRTGWSTPADHRRRGGHGAEASPRSQKSPAMSCSDSRTSGAGRCSSGACWEDPG